MVEVARLESVYTLIAYRWFVSIPFIQLTYTSFITVYFFVFILFKNQQISVFSRLILYHYISLCCIFFMVMCMVTIG